MPRLVLTPLIALALLLGSGLPAHATELELANAAFEQWKDGLPVGWSKSIGARRDPGDTPGRVVGPVGGAAFGLRQGLDEATALLCAEMEGGMRKVIETAVDYAAERFQFSRPIGSFQAIKYKMVNMYVKNTLARSNAYYGAWALNTNAPQLPLAAATARVGSTQAYYYAAKENIQIHGGMGFTWEVDCQFFYRRSKVLAVAIGSERIWQDKLIMASDHVSID